MKHNYIMDNIVKLPSQQALFNNTNNLADFVIPGNSGVYDLSSTYIAISLRAENIELNAAEGSEGVIPAAGGLPAASAIADMRLAFHHGSLGGSIYADTAVPIETLVRDCSMFSSTRGKIEDIRRVDSLRATRKAYLQDMSDVCDTPGPSRIAACRKPRRAAPHPQPGQFRRLTECPEASRYRS